MTIEALWPQCFKTRFPGCFFPCESRLVPPGARIHVAFVDALILTMKVVSYPGMTWNDFFFQRYVAHARRMFDQGAKKVVLAFDDFSIVPEAKSMTQLKRRRAIPKVQFYERDPLPNFVPVGEQWTTMVSSRGFRNKIISVAVQMVPHMCCLQPGEKLIIDWKGEPLEYMAFTEEMRIPPGSEVVNGVIKTMLHCAPLGEADVKFVRFDNMAGDMLVDSIDGDSIPIALIHREARIREKLYASGMFHERLNTQQFLAKYRKCVRNVFIRRMETKNEYEKKERAKMLKEKKLSSLKDSPVQSASSSVSSRPAYEFLDIMELYEELFHHIDPVVQDVMGSAFNNKIRCHYMNLIIGLIGITGTDYTRHVPQTSGKFIFDNMKALIQPLLIAYDVETMQFASSVFINQVICKIYALKYKNHVRSTMCYAYAISEMKASGLAPKTVSAMMSYDTLTHCTRNINWLLLYWNDPVNAPDPFSSDGTDVAGLGMDVDDPSVLPAKKRKSGGNKLSPQGVFMMEKRQIYGYLKDSQGRVRFCGESVF